MSDFDFGFTAVTEEELTVVQQAKETVASTTEGLDKLQEKCDTLYNMIKPLLNNLAANPQKDYIYWASLMFVWQRLKSFQINLMEYITDEFS